MVLEDQGNLSLHAVQADQRYRADQPNPGGLRGLGDPERNDYAYNFYMQKKKPVSKIYNIYTKCFVANSISFISFHRQGSNSKSSDASFIAFLSFARLYRSMFYWPPVFSLTPLCCFDLSFLPPGTSINPESFTREQHRLARCVHALLHLPWSRSPHADNKQLTLGHS